MKHLLLTAGIAVVGGLTVTAEAALAGPIERACMSSGRSANAQLCTCIQQAADLTLSGRDQTRAVAFFRDPHQAQVVRQSGRNGDADFWRRYRAFGQTAEAFCQGG